MATVSASGYFNPEDDAKALQTAMKGLSRLTFLNFFGLFLSRKIASLKAFLTIPKIGKHMIIKKQKTMRHEIA